MIWGIEHDSPPRPKLRTLGHRLRHWRPTFAPVAGAWRIPPALPGGGGVGRNRAQKEKGPPWPEPGGPGGSVRCYGLIRQVRSLTSGLKDSTVYQRLEQRFAPPAPVPSGPSVRLGTGSHGSGSHAVNRRALGRRSHVSSGSPRASFACGCSVGQPASLRNSYRYSYITPARVGPSDSRAGAFLRVDDPPSSQGKRYGVREDLWSVGEISSLGVSRQLEEPVGRGEDEQITLPGNTDEVGGFKIKSEHNHISKRRG